MNNSKSKGVASGVWWIFALAVSAFVTIWILTGKDIAKDDGATSKVKVDAKTQEVIILKPGKTLSLEINDKDWSPWIDASKKGLYSYAHAPHGLVYLFSNGEKLEIKPENTVRIKGSLAYKVYKLKARVEKDIATIETSTNMDWETTSQYGK
jgi:hypothetical protein